MREGVCDKVSESLCELVNECVDGSVSVAVCISECAYVEIYATMVQV